MNEGKLNDILTKASQIMNNERFNAIVEGKAKNIIINEDGSVVQNNITKQNFQENKQNFNFSTPTDNNASINTQKKSGLPKEILESFKKTPPINGSIPNTQITPTPLQTNNIINETIKHDNSVDYTIIKAIVNECLNSKFNEIKEALINESTIKGFTLKDGNKIQFLTKKGDLYEGELKLKKRKTNN